MCFMQRYIYISGKGIINHFLGMGISDICRLYELAQSGAVTNAENININYSYNCDLMFKGVELLKFLDEYYPEYYAKYSAYIVPNETYKISAVDYS
ncbi:MAG TPA: hypothetical protein PLH98_16550 [Ruminococcus flavefaciens]|nr:hypothetical protein [Ruminococcus flavefaciens]